MERASKVLFRIGLSILFMLASIAPLKNGQADIGQPGEDEWIYLPLVMNRVHTYIGTITDNGVPIAGQLVDLRFYDGIIWSTHDTQITDATGAYSFINLPSLTSGQGYYVRWLNTIENDNYLSAWLCDTIDIENIDYDPFTCDFNIHNIFHVKPDGGDTVRLPETFEWTMRPTTSDNYELDIADMSDEDPWWWTAPPLGYVNTYRLISLPTGFQTNVQYGWFMEVYGLNGVGVSYYFRYVTFQNSGSVILGPENPTNHQLWSERMERNKQDRVFPVKE